MQKKEHTKNGSGYPEKARRCKIKRQNLSYDSLNYNNLLYHITFCCLIQSDTVDFIMMPFWGSLNLTSVNYLSYLLRSITFPSLKLLESRKNAITNLADQW